MDYWAKRMLFHVLKWSSILKAEWSMCVLVKNCPTLASFTLSPSTPARVLLQIEPKEIKWLSQLRPKPQFVVWSGTQSPIRQHCQHGIQYCLYGIEMYWAEPEHLWHRFGRLSFLTHLMAFLTQVPALLRALLCLPGTRRLSRARGCCPQASSRWVCHLQHSCLLHQQTVLMAFVLSQHCLLWPGRVESLDLSLQILTCSTFRGSLQGLDIILSKVGKDVCYLVENKVCRHNHWWNCVHSWLNLLTGKNEIWVPLL